MTREEAIRELKADYCGNRIICELYPDQCNREDCEIWWAINALENVENGNSTPESAQNVPNQAFKMQKSDGFGDTISRQAAINIVYEIDTFQAGWRFNAMEQIKALPSAQPESTRTFVELVVEYPDPELCTYKEYKGKPYYSIKYIENGETYVWYGTYNPEVLSQYLKEYFISSTQPEITPDGTLNVSIDADIANVGRILLSQTGTQYGGLYYKDEQPEPKWIPCKERLPDKDGLYLVTYFSGHARWTGTDEFLVDGTEESHWKYANIIAWQPLPKPFREGGDYA